MLYFAVVVLMGVLSLGDAKYAYTKVAVTTDGKPCVTDCVDGKCIVDFQENEKTCISSGVKPMTFSTSQLGGKDIRPHCLSNCGRFGFNYEWCYTDEERHTDFCNSSPEDRTPYMTKCESPCAKIDGGYPYKCKVGNINHYCAPPAITNEPNVDANKENLGPRNVGNTCTCTCSLPETNP